MLSINKPLNEKPIDFKKDDKAWKLFNEAVKKLPKQIEIPLIINGKEFYTKEKINSVSPINKEIIAVTQKADNSHLELAIETALNAKKEWQNLSIESRIQKFRDLEWILRNKKFDILASCALECGFTPSELAGGYAEMMDFMTFNPYYYHQLSKTKLGDGNYETNKLSLRPLKGFTTAITPFNFPVAIGYNLPSVMALTGNTVVWKPSSDTPLTSYILMKSLDEAGFPGGIINMITGPGEKIMPQVLKHRDLLCVNFTGGYNTAKNIAYNLFNENCPRPHFPRYVVETGGKGFMIVDKDADIADAARQIIAGAFGRSGQKCSSNSLVLPHRGIYSDLKDALLEQMKHFKVGNPVDKNCDMGPVINETAFNKITGYIERALEDKACNIFCGGNFSKDKGYFIEPTFIETENKLQETIRNEIFGPVITFYPVENIDEAIEIIDENDYRLTGGLYSKSEAVLEKYVPILSNYAGNFYINRKITGAIVDQQPFGGDGASGTNSKAGGSFYLLQFISMGTITRRHSRK